MAKVGFYILFRTKLTTQKPPGSNTGVLSAFPAKSRAMVQLLAKNRSTELGKILADFLPSAIPPGPVCSVGVLACAYKEVKIAFGDLFTRPNCAGFNHYEAGQCSRGYRDIGKE